jgi:hypothetical protein
VRSCAAIGASFASLLHFQPPAFDPFARYPDLAFNDVPADAVHEPMLNAGSIKS